MQWSDALCSAFDLQPSLLPPLRRSSSVLGPVLQEVANTLNIPSSALVIAGGGDTQLAIKSTRPAVDDMVIVSGTTTPIVKLTGDYTLDAGERTGPAATSLPAALSSKPTPASPVSTTSA